ncbi:hypothetical protein MRX96_036823 [Rhipicephalus microplus]
MAVSDAPFGPQWMLRWGIKIRYDSMRHRFLCHDCRNPSSAATLSTAPQCSHHPSLAPTVSALFLRA